MKQLLSSQKDIASLILRIFFAVVLFPHGAQKLLGWFNGYGFAGTMSFFTDTVKIPWIIGFVVIMLEFFGSIFILVGFGTRQLSIAMLILMIGIIVTSFPNYFFMDWFGTQKQEGFEFFLLMIGMSLALIVSGAGRFSLDSWLRLKTQKG